MNYSIVMYDIILIIFSENFDFQVVTIIKVILVLQLFETHEQNTTK